MDGSFIWIENEVFQDLSISPHEIESLRKRQLQKGSTLQGMLQRSLVMAKYTNKGSFCLSTSFWQAPWQAKKHGTQDYQFNKDCSRCCTLYVTLQWTLLMAKCTNSSFFCLTTSFWRAFLAAAEPRVPDPPRGPITPPLGSSPCDRVLLCSLLNTDPLACSINGDTKHTSNQQQSNRELQHNNSDIRI